MTTIHLKKAEASDLSQLQKISRSTFFEAFADTNDAENMKKYSDESFSQERLAAELNNENSKFYFALSNDDVIGYLKLNFGPSQTELQDQNALEIERIYVLQSFHGKKVGQLLYEKAIEVATELKVEYVWLGVWEDNPRAIRFYKKNGFVEFDKHIFKLGNEEQTDIMMKLQLKPDLQT